MTSPKIVCIEDEPQMVDLLTLVLSKHDYEVYSATDGFEGLQLIAALKPDLVLLDLMMPDIGGWEVYQKMKADKKLRDIPVIIVTAKSQDIDKVLGLHIAKVDGYVTKPFKANELVSAVDKILNHSKS